MMASNNKDIFSLKPSEGLQQRLHIDFPLFLAFMAIFMISLTTIYSASNSSIDAVVNQGIKILISISAMADSCTVQSFELCQSWTLALFPLPSVIDLGSSDW